MAPTTLQRNPTAATAAVPANRQARRAFLVLGVGLGAFVDGIVLHQIVQWHHLVSAEGEHDMRTLAGLEANTLADGLFHLAAFALTAAGVAMLTCAARDDGPLRRLGGPTIVGTLLAGWGAFNLVEGVVNHHLLTLHHVRDDVADPTGWDVGFLMLSAAILAIGVLLARRRRAPAPLISPGGP